MKTYKAIREALIAMLQSVTTTNGYSTTLPAANFFQNYDKSKLDVTEPLTYPKVFVSRGDTRTVSATSRRKEIEDTFYVTVIVLESEAPGGVATPAQEQVEALANDVEKACLMNYNLGGLVIATDLTSISMDSGFVWPEGIAIFEITVKWHQQY